MNAEQIIQRNISEAKQRKRDQWEEIKRTNPKLAEFMMQLGKCFGKFELIKLTN